MFGAEDVGVVANSDFAEVFHEKLHALCMEYWRDFDVETELGEALHAILIDVVPDGCLKEFAHVRRGSIVSLCTQCSRRSSRTAHAHFAVEKILEAP